MPADHSGSLIVGPHRQFDDDLLRAINILVGAPGEEPRLNPKLCGLGRYVFVLRDPTSEFVVDLLTPLGLLSGQRCGAYSVLVPWPDEPLLDLASVLGTTSTREAALLLSLGFPVALLRHIRTSSPLDFREFWRPRWTAVPGCQALLNLSAPRIEPVPAPTAPSCGATPVPAASPDDNRDGDPIHCATLTSAATIELAGAAPLAEPVAHAAGADFGQHQPPVELPAGALPQWNTFGRTSGVTLRSWRQQEAQPLYDIDCLVGSSLLGLSPAVPIQVEYTCEDLQAGMRRYNCENSLPRLLQLESSDMEILRDLLTQEHPLENVQEELHELLLISRKRPEEVWPSLAENGAGPAALPTVAAARQALLDVLAESTTTASIQQEYDRFVAAVDREDIQPLRDVAAAEHRAVSRSLHAQYADAVRNTTLIEPFAVINFVPAQLKIDVAFDRESPRVAHAKQVQQVLEFLKLLVNLQKRY